jgi:two-component system, NarL family, nitrate/nitrite response regulator NarL
MVGKKVSIALLGTPGVVAEGIRSWVDSDPGNRTEIIAIVDSVEALLTGPGRDADVLLLDLEFGDTNSTDRVAGLSEAGYRIVAFSAPAKSYLVQAALDAGACTFLDQRAEREHFIDTLIAVAHDEPLITPSMDSGLLRAVRLSERERQALRYLFQGMDYASIANRLKKPTGEPISALTVKQYVERARAKYAAAGRPCRSNFALLARCIEDGLVRPEDINDYRSAHTGQ